MNHRRLVMPKTKTDLVFPSSKAVFSTYRYWPSEFDKNSQRTVGEFEKSLMEKCSKKMETPKMIKTTRLERFLSYLRSWIFSDS